MRVLLVVVNIQFEKMAGDDAGRRARFESETPNPWNLAFYPPGFVLRKGGPYDYRVSMSPQSYEFHDVVNQRDLAGESSMRRHDSASALLQYRCGRARDQLGTNALRLGNVRIPIDPDSADALMDRILRRDGVPEPGGERRANSSD
jgi:hypothetical protein